MHLVSHAIWMHLELSKRDFITLADYKRINLTIWITRFTVKWKNLKSF